MTSTSVIFTMEIKHSLSHSQSLSAIDGQLRGTQVSMKSDDGLVLEWFFFGSDLQRSPICDENVFCLKLDVLFIKHQFSAWQRENNKG